MMQHVVFKEINRKNLKKALMSVMPSQTFQPTKEAVEVRSSQGINSTKFIPIDHDTLDYDTVDYDLEENQFLFRENSGSSTPSSFVEVQESHKQKLEEQLYSLSALIDTLNKSNQEYKKIQKVLTLELKLSKLKNQDLEEKLAIQQNIIEELNGKNSQLTQVESDAHTVNPELVESDAHTVNPELVESDAHAVNPELVESDVHTVNPELVESDAHAVNPELEEQMITREQRQNQLISFLFDKIKNSVCISTEFQGTVVVKHLYNTSIIKPVMTGSEINAKKIEFGLTI